MDQEYYLVHKSLLPEYYETVIKIREEIEQTKIDVSSACKKYNISRSTYYKYKDYVFKPMKEYSNKAIISLHVKDIKGVLSNILNVISTYNINVISLNQDMPIHDDAFISFTLDLTESKISINELLNNLRNIEYVTLVDLIAFEG